MKNTSGKTGIFVLIILFCSCSLYPQENLISNGDFETRETAPWSLPDWIKNGTKPQIDRAVFQGFGNASLRFSGEKGKRAFAMQRVRLNPQIKKLKFGGWIKTENMQNHWTASIALECVIIDSGKESYKYFKLTTLWQLVETPWMKYEMTVEIPENTQYAGMILQTEAPDGKLERSNTGTVRFDNIFLEPLTE